MVVFESYSSNSFGNEADPVDWDGLLKEDRPDSEVSDE